MRPLTAPRCPTPGKYRYNDRSTAKRWARVYSRNGLGKLLKPYLCPCGFWHLTTTRRTAAEVNDD